jgi:hypothetical protein
MPFQLVLSQAPNEYDFNIFGGLEVGVVGRRRSIRSTVNKKFWISKLQRVRYGRGDTYYGYDFNIFLEGLR